MINRSKDCSVFIAHFYSFLFLFFPLVVGEKEMNSNTVNVRTRDNKVHGEKDIAALLARFNDLAQSKKDDSEAEF